MCVNSLVHLFGPEFDRDDPASPTVKNVKVWKEEDGGVDEAAAAEGKNWWLAKESRRRRIFFIPYFVYNRPYMVDFL